MQNRKEVKFGLTEAELEMIISALKRFKEITQVKIFGSRAIGSQRYNSDIDMAFWGNIDDRLLGSIYRNLDDLPLPYIFDIKAYSGIIHAPLREHIDKYGIDFPL